MKNFIKVKQASDVILKGISISGALVDGKANSVSLSDEDGNEVVIQHSGNYSTDMEILVLEKPEQYVVKGTILNLPIEQPFLNKDEAQSFIDKTKNSLLSEHYKLELVIKRQSKPDEILPF